MLRLEELRKNKGVSQETLAKELNMTQQRISSYEKDKREPDIETLKQFADYFNCTIDYITGKSDIRNPEEIKNIQHANAGGLDTNGLDDEDMLELQRQIDYIKKMKGKNK